MKKIIVFIAGLLVFPWLFALSFKYMEFINSVIFK